LTGDWLPIPGDGQPAASFQNGGFLPWLRAVPYSRRLRQISVANWERRSGGVARIIPTAAATGMTEDSPFMLVTAVSHWASDLAPLAAGLNCRVTRPIPTARRVFPQRTLQERQVQIRFAGDKSSSCPFTCPTSIPAFLRPQNAHCRGLGGGHAFARRRNALSVTCSLRHRCAHAGRVSPSRRPLRRPLRLRRRLREFRRSHRVGLATHRRSLRVRHFRIAAIPVLLPIRLYSSFVAP